MADEVKINYGGNSHKSKKPPVEDKVISKVITGEVVQRKKPLGRKIAETFTGDDAQSVGTYILFDVILPAAKSMVSDAVSQGVERLLFGDSARRPGAGRIQGRTNYNKMYSSGKSESLALPAGGHTLSQKARATHDFDEIVMETRGEAEVVLDGLGLLIDQYEVAAVSDLYGLIGVTGSFADDKWGWYDLRGSSISGIKNGYLLNLPKPQPID